MEPDSLTKRYTIRDVASTLHVSRTTLLYYEEQGVVRPIHDPETGYRYYTDADLFRLISGKILKNVGVPVRELADRLDTDPFSPGNFSDYARLLERRIDYCRAQKACLAKLTELSGLVGTVSVVEVEPYYIDFDGAEVGYSRFAGTDSLDSLAEAMPIGGLGTVFVDRDDGRHLERRGRTVPVRYAHLVDNLADDMDVIGGCTCVRLVINTSRVHHEGEDEALGGQERENAFQTIRRHLDEHGLEPVGNVFCPYCLPSEHGFVAPFCQPVSFLDGRGKRGGHGTALGKRIRHAVERRLSSIGNAFGATSRRQHRSFGCDKDVV